MGVKKLEDGSYDLRGATAEDVGAAIDDYFRNTPPEKNVFLIDESKGVTRRIRERLGELIEDIKLWFNSSSPFSGKIKKWMA